MEKGTRLSLGDSVLPYFGLVRFIMERRLQTGSGEMCSTLFALKILIVSESVSCDILRKFS